MPPPPPQRQSIQWTSSAPMPDAGSQRDMGSPKYRQYPTPHPKKMAETATYLAESRDIESRGSRDWRSGSNSSNSVRIPPNSGKQGGPTPRRATLPRRSSTMDSEFFRDRNLLHPTLSSAEEGRRERQHRGSSGGGVVAELIQYGMRHGLGRGTQSNSGERMTRAVSASSLYEADTKTEEKKNDGTVAMTRRPSYGRRCSTFRDRKRSQIVHHLDSYVSRQKFILRLAKALLSFGAPSHRIESQLHSAGEILGVNVGFVHLPNLIVASFMDSDTRTSETHFVRAGGRVALTKLHKVHFVYRDVLHDKIGAVEGCEKLKRIIQEQPLYNIWVRVMLAFICASIICVLSFGGSVVDMFVSGASAALLQYLGLNAASKSTIYANVYEITVSILVSFIARLLGTLPGNIFCYSAISSAGVVLILPGFTILISALELTSRNILCGSVRMVYAIIYTLFLGFGLTIGSDFYLLVNPGARHNMAATALINSQQLHGFIVSSNASSTTPLAELGATFTFMDTGESAASHIVKGCYRNPDWPWWRQPFPWWAMLFLVPIYSTCSSIANLQSIWSLQLPVMVIFSCLAYAANRTANYLISERSDIVSAFGAFVIGLCGNAYSRLVGGTAFTSMITGVLFLVPSAIGNGGGLIQSYHSSVERYSSSFELGIRMIQVAIGVTIGLLVSQILVYALGRRKSAAHFAF